jgi:FG-GAP-like repeat
MERVNPQNGPDANRSSVADDPGRVSSSTPAAALSRRRLVAIGKVSLLVGLLALHFAARWHYAQVMPLADRHNYERAYAYSLSLLAGKGFHDLPVGATSEAAPIARFLDKQSDSVAPEEFRAFLEHPTPSAVEADFGEHRRWASSRILDHYLVAGLWRLFGIRWQVVFFLGAALSTLVCLLVFLIGRRLGGSFWAGLCGAALFFASPLGSFLETWSLRDSSPLWFAAAGFWFLICVVDRSPAPKRRLALCAGLGILAMVGIGWRPDVLLLVLYLGIGMLALLWIRGLSWRELLMSLGVYAAGAWCCHAAIFALSDEPTVDAQHGLHMAVYADFSRANLLKIENSFQIERCDRETLFVARQWWQAHTANASPLAFMGDHYSQVCRAMFFAEMRYNAFRLVSNFPDVYWKALKGLFVPDAFETRDEDQLRDGRLPWLSPVLENIFDPVTRRLPWLFVIGLFVATSFGPARAAAALLGGFSLVQAAALLLVLPEQKHVAGILLPLNVLGGIGLWALIRLLCPSNLRQAVKNGWAPPIKAWLCVATTTTAVWGVGCLVSHELSVHERRQLIAAIQDAARGAPAAPETLHGDKVFSIGLLPGSPLDATGYLLRISAGREPGTLLCRHIHFPQDWCWPRVLETTHLLTPSREQYFFVSCLQGSQYGDPRPYNCSVFLGGDARIESCQRVDLTHWDRLQVSTLFYDGQDSPGSPRSVQSNSVMRWPNWPAIRSFCENEQDEQRLARDSLSLGAQPLPPVSYPIQHLIARDTTNGTWRVAISNGRKFQPAQCNYWAPREWSALVSGDFNGDGLTDLLGRYTDGVWWIGVANGNNLRFKPVETGLSGVKFDFVGVGDFNGDGIDDLVVRSADDGQLWIGDSDGMQFHFRRWGQCAPGVPPEHLRIADFNGDGRADVAGFNPLTGEWSVSLSDGARFVTHGWGGWDAKVAWRHILAADFTGNGRSDIAAWNPATGEWQLAQSDGRQFASRTIGAWPADADWQYVQTGRFSGDRRHGIVALDKKAERIAIATLDAGRLSTRYLTSHLALAGGILVGNFAGGDRDNLVGLTKDHVMWVGTLDGDSLRFENWGAWPAAGRLADFRVVRFWR